MGRRPVRRAALRPARHPAAGAVGVLAALALVAGCSAAGSAAAPSTVQPPGQRSGTEKAATGFTGDQPSADLRGADLRSTDPAAGEQRLVRTATITVRVTDVPETIATVRAVAQRAKGFVADEQTSYPGRGARPEGTGPAARSVLTLRVPNAALDELVRDLGATGTVLDRQQASEDVTGQYVDTASRVRSQQASVDRVRALLAQATKIGEVVQIEGELARREADLDALQARLKALQDQTSLATLTVTLTAVPATAKTSDDGFAHGLSAGWSALVASATTLLTALGAVLPFVVLLALVAVPLGWWWRRRGPAPGADAPAGQPPA